MTTLSRVEFLAQKQLRFGRDSLENLYGCPYWALFEWAMYKPDWWAAKIMMARDSVTGSTRDELLAFIKKTNAGINKISREYEKAAGPFRMAGS